METTELKKILFLHKLWARGKENGTRDNFNLTYNIECASGIHFFKTEEEAINYQGRMRLRPMITLLTER